LVHTERSRTGHLTEKYALSALPATPQSQLRTTLLSSTDYIMPNEADEVIRRGAALLCMTGRRSMRLIGQRLPAKPVSAGGPLTHRPLPSATGITVSKPLLAQTAPSLRHLTRCLCDHGRKFTASIRLPHVAQICIVAFSVYLICTRRDEY
jgi:hypothetical protein